MRYNKSGFPEADRQTPWGKQGVDVSHSDTTSNAAVDAGLCWDVDTEPAYMRVGDAVHVPVPNCKYTVRSDREPDDVSRILGPVSGSFKVTQNLAAFSLFDPLLEAGQLELVSAGEMHGGKSVWMVGKMLLGRAVINSESAVGLFLVLRNTHNGGGSLSVQFVVIDDATNTSVGLPIKGCSHNLRFRHSNMVQAEIANGKSEIHSSAFRYFNDNARMLSVLDGVRVTDSLITNILLNIYPPRRAVKADGIAIEARSAIHGLFLDADHRTGYTLWLAICSYIDHSKGLNRRLEALLWHEKYLQKTKLAPMLLKLLRV